MACDTRLVGYGACIENESLSHDSGKGRKHLVGLHEAPTETPSKSASFMPRLTVPDCVRCPRSHFTIVPPYLWLSCLKLDCTLKRLYGLPALFVLSESCLVDSGSSSMGLSLSFLEAKTL